MVQINQGDETVQFGGRTYRKFWPPYTPVTDGTVRCLACGQIDEDGAHDDGACWMTPDASPSPKPQEER